MVAVKFGDPLFENNCPFNLIRGHACADSGSVRTILEVVIPGKKGT